MALRLQLLHKLPTQKMLYLRKLKCYSILKFQSQMPSTQQSALTFFFFFGRICLCLSYGFDHFTAGGLVFVDVFWQSFWTVNYQEHDHVLIVFYNTFQHLSHYFSHYRCLGTLLQGWQGRLLCSCLSLSVYAIKTMSMQQW